MSITIKAYAKINLNLEILRKLPNGYHEIRSIFQAVDIYDLISISRRTKGYELSGAIICPIEENIITKAKKGLENFLGKELPCSINLIKNLPVSAGLGGGSSDAAVTLIGLNKVYSLSLDAKQLIEIGTKIGGDIPFFIANCGTALVGGIGEKIKPIKRKLSNIYVLIRPHRRISTIKMYEEYDKTGKDFFTLAQKICPEIGKVYNYFSKLSKECGMSGSGPTVFADFDSYNEAIKSIKGFGIEEFNGDFFICSPTSKTYEIFS